jgi:hypothetical protein
MCRHAARVAARFERANSGVLLLELVCQIRAALDELGALADQRDIELHSLAPRARSWVGAFFRWVNDLWPRPTQAGYRTIAATAMRDVEIAARLRLAALRVGDHVLADWSARWMAQRVGLIERLTTSLGIADAHRYARLGTAALEAPP